MKQKENKQKKKQKQEQKEEIHQKKQEEAAIDLEKSKNEQLAAQLKRLEKQKQSLSENNALKASIKQFTSTHIDKNQLDDIDINNRLSIPQSIIRK